MTLIKPSRKHPIHQLPALPAPCRPTQGVVGLEATSHYLELVLLEHLCLKAWGTSWPCSRPDVNTPALTHLINTDWFWISSPEQEQGTGQSWQTPACSILLPSPSHKTNTSASTICTRVLCTAQAAITRHMVLASSCKTGFRVCSGKHLQRHFKAPWILQETGSD